MNISDFLAGLFQLVLFPIYYPDNILILSAVSFFLFAFIFFIFMKLGRML